MRCTATWPILLKCIMSHNHVMCHLEGCVRLVTLAAQQSRRHWQECSSLIVTSKCLLAGFSLRAVPDSCCIRAYLLVFPGVCYTSIATELRFCFHCLQSLTLQITTSTYMYQSGQLRGGWPRGWGSIPSMGQQLFFLSITSRPTAGPAQPLIQRIPELFSQR